MHGEPRIKYIVLSHGINCPTYLDLTKPSSGRINYKGENLCKYKYPLSSNTYNSRVLDTASSCQYFKFF